MPPLGTRQRALEVAKAVIGGRTLLVRGVRELADLAGKLCADPLSPTLLPILAAADDTRDLALDWSTRTLSSDETEDLFHRIDEAENEYREAVLGACRRLVRKLERGTASAQ